MIDALEEVPSVSDIAFKPSETSITSSPSSQRCAAITLDDFADILFHIDADGRWAALNMAWEILTGFSIGTSIGKPAIDFVSATDQKQFQAILHRLDESITPITFAFQLCTKHGFCWVEMKASTPASCKGVSGVIRNINECDGQLRQYDENMSWELSYREIISNLESQINEYKHREQTLSHNSSFLQALMDNLPAQIYFKDLEGRFLCSNQMHIESLEKERLEDVISYTDYDFYIDHLAQEAEADERRIVATGQPLIDKSECQILTTNFTDSKEVNQKKQWFTTTKAPIRNMDGNIIGIVGITYDITERRRIEDAHAGLAAIIEATPELVVIMNNDWRILYCNKSGRKMLGLQLQTQIEDLSFDTFYSPWFADCINQEGLPTAKREGVWSSEGEFTRRDGRGFPVFCTLLAHCSPEGMASTFSIIASDISDRKRAEDLLRHERSLLTRRVAERTLELSIANMELARSTRLKDEFLANMSHELRTPLNAVLGLSEALQEQVYGSVNDRQKQILRGIEESGRHLLSLINDILDLSKIEAGKLELNYANVAIVDLCQSSLRMIAQYAHQKQITIFSNIDESLATMYADERRLKQILVNLLSNAVKFTPPGGSIGIEVVADANQEKVIFTVWDTGIGIDKVNIEQLFQPFVQIDSKLSRQYNGTGLGLTLVHRMVALCKGSISVSSEINKGSRFTVAIPLKVAENDNSDNELTKPLDVGYKKKPAFLNKGEPSRSASILLVEDNEDNIIVLADYLQSKGYEIMIARNGIEALEYMHNARPDLVLMDIQMPSMDGFETTKRMRADKRLEKIPIVALTALAMKGDRERCLEVGVSEYLSKPVPLRKLRVVIEEQLAKSTGVQIFP